MLITYGDQNHDLRLPMVGAKLEADKSALATLRAMIELEVAGIARTQRNLTRYIREKDYHPIGENSATIVGRALERLAEAGLIYERRGSNRTTQYLSIFVAPNLRRKTNHANKDDSPSPAPQFDPSIEEATAEE